MTTTSTFFEPVGYTSTADMPEDPLAVLAARAVCALEKSLQRLVLASDQNLGHLEQQAAQDVQELPRQAVQRGAQAKADATPPVCPVCGQKLTLLSSGHSRSFATRFGSVTVQRTHDYCKRCHKWRVPGDATPGVGRESRLFARRASHGRAADQQNACRRRQHRFGTAHWG